METLLAVAFWANVTANEPQPYRLTWEKLAGGLQRHHIRAGKDGRLWSPTEYREGTTRGIAGVETLCCLVLDFDRGTPPEVFREAWEPWEHVVYSTFSSTPESPKWRAVFPLVAAVPAADWPAVYRKLVAALADGATDPSCKDASRIYYLPSAPPDTEPFAFRHEGAWLDPEQFPDPEPEPVRVYKPLPPQDSAGTGRPAADLLLARSLERLGEGRDNAGMWLAVQLRDNGYSAAEAEAIMREYVRYVPPTNTKGEVEEYGERHALATLRKVYAKPPRSPWPENERPALQPRDSRPVRPEPEPAPMDELGPEPSAEGPDPEAVPLPEAPPEEANDGSAPPRSELAERATLGGLLRCGDGVTIREVFETLAPPDFYWRAHDYIAAAVRDLTDARQPVDEVTVAEHLTAAGRLADCGGREYLRRLIHACPRAETVATYARIVKAKARLRDLIALCDDTARQCHQEGAQPDALEDYLTRLLLSYRGREPREAVCYADVLEAELARIGQGETEPVLEFGMRAIDRLTGGLGRGEVGLICGRPGTGKSVWCAMQLHAAAQAWGAVLYVSLEMGAAEVVRRDLAGRAKLTFRELREAARFDDDGRRSPFTAGDRERLENARRDLLQAARRIWIDEHSSTLSKLVSRIHRYRLQRDIQALILDYGQLVRDDTAGKGVAKAEEVMRVARALKTEVAVPENLPVWVAVQANRNSEQGMDRKKMLSYSDLGWSGEWEAVAGRILFLNPDPGRAADPEKKRNPILLDVAKNRHGTRGEVRLTLNGPEFRFEEETERYAGEEPPESTGDRRAGLDYDE